MSKDNNNLTILSGQSVLLPSQNEIQRRIYSIRGVQVLSYDLKLCQIVNTGCFFSTFQKIDNGFACLSMGSEQNFLFLRDDGVPVYSKQLSDKYPDEIQDGNPIQIGMDGYPYVKAYYSDTVFKWNGQELVESVQFDYGMGEPGGDYQKGSQLAHSGIAYTESYFLTNTHVLSSFVETDGRTIHYNLYDKENGVSCRGRNSDSCTNCCRGRQL